MELKDLLDNAAQNGHTVEYLSLSHNPSFCVEDEDGCHIVLSNCIYGTEEKEALAHELGHCNYGGFYNAYSKYGVRARAERRADKWSFSNLLPIGEVRAACKHGVRESWQLAEQFNVSYEFASRAVDYYRQLGLI